MQRLCSLVGLAGFRDQASHLVSFYEGVNLDCLHIHWLEKSWLGLADGEVLLCVCWQAIHFRLPRGVQSRETLVITAHAGRARRD